MSKRGGKGEGGKSRGGRGVASDSKMEQIPMESFSSLSLIGPVLLRNVERSSGMAVLRLREREEASLCFNSFSERTRGGGLLAGDSRGGAASASLLFSLSTFALSKYYHSCSSLLFFSFLSFSCCGYRSNLIDPLDRVFDISIVYVRLPRILQ